MRSFGIFDNFVPSRESFESGARQLLGGPCEHNCAGHDAMVKSTADVMQGAAQGVAEAGNRYYPELAKSAALAALPVEALAAKAATALAGREITLVGGFYQAEGSAHSSFRSITTRSFGIRGEERLSCRRRKC